MADNNWVIVSADVAEVQKALEGTTKSITSIQRQTLGIIARGTVKAIKAGIAESTTKRTGELLKCYAYRVRKDGSKANVYPRGSSGAKIFPKVFIQNFGHEGPTKTKKDWRVMPKGFVEKGEQYAESGGYNQDIQKMIDRELAKVWS